MALPLLKVSFIMNFFAVLWVLCAIILILLILVQKGKGGGLSAAFGGGMGGGILGSKTGDFLTWFTIVLVGVFLFLSIVLAKFYKPISGRYDAPASQQEQPTQQPAGETAPPGDMGMPVEE